MKRLALLASVLVLAAPAIAQEQTVPLELTWRTATTGPVLVRNATLWTQDGNGVLDNTDLLVADGKIVAVGRDLSAGGEVLVIDGTGMHVTPGIIDAHSHAGSDGTNEGSNNITAEVRVEDVLNPTRINIYQQIAGGTTAAQVLHGSANAIGGQSALVKWRYKPAAARDMLIEGAIPTIKFALGENPKRSAFSLPIPGLPRRYPATRMGVANSIRRAFLAAKDYQAEWLAYNALPAAQQLHTVPPRHDLQLEALVEILEDTRKVHSHSYRQDEIIMLIRLAEELGFKVNTFQHVLEGYRASHEIAAHGASASTFSDWWAYKIEAYEAIPYNGSIMHDDGVLVSFNSDDGELARHLNLEAAKAVRYGNVPESEALAFVTSNPARQLHLFDRMGSITVGKDADFVVWNGHPLSIYSRPEYTFIDGRKVFDRALDRRIQEARDAEKARIVALIADDDAEVEEGSENEEGSEGEGGSEDEEGATTDDPGESGGDPDPEAAHRFAEPVSRRYSANADDSGATAIVGATVHTVAGDVIDNGVVIFDQGVITAVGGADTAIPAGARRVDATGKHLFPGMISMDSQLGLTEIDSVAGTVDTAEIDDFNSDLRAEVAVNASSELIPVARAGGVTHALTAPRGGTIAGASALLRLDGWTWEEMTGLSRAGMHMIFPGGGGGGFPFGPPASSEDLARQRKEALARVDAFLDDARAYGKAKQAESAGGPRHRVDVKLEGMQPVLAGQVPLIIHTRGATAIKAALEWAAEYEFRIVILDSGDTWRAAAELAAANVPVVISSVMAIPRNADDPYDAMYANAGKLWAAGVKLAIGDGSGPSNERNVPFQAGFAAAYGLPREQALRAVTLTPAEILGLDDTLGSIEVGKSATLVLADGDLLEIRSHVLAAWIDGRPADLESKHTRSWNKWRDRPAGR